MEIPKRSRVQLYTPHKPLRVPRTWYVGELNLFGHRSDFVLQLLVPETHHLPFEGGRQQLLLPGLTQAVDVALRREAAETVLHEGVRLPEHPAVPRSQTPPLR